MNFLKRLSFYLINKRAPEAIVYRDVEDHITRLSETMFSSREEFLRWKHWSDENYAEIERGDRAYYAHTVPLTEYSSTTPSAEDIVLTHIDWHDRRLLTRQDAINLMLMGLTKKQRRHFILRYVGRKSQKEIAQRENVSQQTISRSLKAARKKISSVKCKLSVNKYQKWV